MENWNQQSDPWLLREIGKAIQHRRLAQNLSQEELSQRSGVSKPSIARFETGRGNISLTNLLSILKALQMANELQAIFAPRIDSPSVLARAIHKGTQRRVRRTKKMLTESQQPWTWGEDQ